ncbi:MAG: S1C family serine protease, partial [Pseudonocardiaceae bacterium]
PQGWPTVPGIAVPLPGGPPPPASRPRRWGLLFAVVAVVLALGLIAGGIGGAIGYQLARSGSDVDNALNRPVPDARPGANLPEGSVEQVAQRVTPTVLQLRVRGPQLAGEGSGIVLSSDGLILTNNHVIEPAADGGSVEAVFHDGRTMPVEIIGRARSFDLAVVRAQGISGLPIAELGRSDDILVGQQVLAIGAPLGLSSTVTAGIISAVNRPVRAGGEGSDQDTVLDAVQTDAAINPGNSGGPLVDMAGRVVGVNSAIASIGSDDGQAGSIGLGFAIPIDQARRIADELIQTGRATQAVLGVTVPARQPNGSGAVIQQVMPDSAAASAGLQPGETITRVDDRVIENGDALVAAIRSYPPGSQITLTVKGGANTTEQQVGLTLGSQQVGSS